MSQSTSSLATSAQHRPVQQATSRNIITLLPSPNPNLSNSPSKQPNSKRRKIADFTAPTHSASSDPLQPLSASLSTHLFASSRYTGAAPKNRLPNIDISNGSFQSKRKSNKPSQDNEKRTLRSHDGRSRVKSDLNKYFPDYEDVVFGPPKDPDILTADSTIYIVDKIPKYATKLPISSVTGDLYGPDHSTNGEVSSGHPDRSNAASNSSPIHQPHNLGSGPSFRRVDFSGLRPEAQDINEDPLSDDLYLASHGRAEKKEKQMRNIEREHAMHEKSELERIVAELKGPDWLRTMGISGVTETEKRRFEPRRDRFIKRVQALINRFAEWKEQEKRLKIRRERVLAEREEAEDFEDETKEKDNEEKHVGGSDGDKIHDEFLDRAHDEGMGTANEDSGSNTSRTRDSAGSVNSLAGTRQEILSAAGDRQDKASEDDIDGSVIQLQREAGAAAGSVSATLLKSTTTLKISAPKPFRSFYKKPYQRAAALEKHRRGRAQIAFGQPIPEMPEAEFELPEGFVSEEIVRANSRKRRRMKRQRDDD